MNLTIERNADVSLLTTLRLPGRAEFLCEVGGEGMLRQALAFAKERKLSATVLGGGSNTVIGRDIKGLVIKLATRGIRAVSEDKDAVVIRVAAGESWHELVKSCLRNKLYGLENLALIPGSVGAAPIQNIGAYGVELGSFLQGVEVIEVRTGAARTLSAEQCQLAYRDSVFKRDLRGKVIITQVLLRLSRTPSVNISYPALREALADIPHPAPEDVFAAVCRIRTLKLPDPARIPNAGSFFKNPVLGPVDAGRLVKKYPYIPHYPQENGDVKFPAAWFIDQAGWKGFRDGAVGVHPNQALVLVNYGGATSAELLGLAGRISSDIKQKFGVTFEMEPVVIGVNNS